MKYFNFLAAVMLSVLYLTAYIPPTERYNLWFSIFVIPFAMVANTLLPIVAAIRRERSALFYVVPMIIGFPFLLSTVGIKGYFRSSDANSKTFTLLSYNISNFGVKSGVREDKSIDALRDLVLNPETDIQCYQEFSNFPWSQEGNVIRRLTELNRHFYFSVAPDIGHPDYVKMGTLIVSKFPIVGKGDVLEGSSGFNRITYVDVVINSDTVRIVNAHLHSMGLGRFDPRTKTEIKEVGRATRTILSKLKEGVFERSTQAQELTRFVNNTPYPVVCAGDFNDMPYSYTYRYIRRHMKNAFEESGRGFGFTYNGGTLRVLRIDNAFYSGRIEAVDLQTRYDIPLTDHFPIQGTFQIPPR